MRPTGQAQPARRGGTRCDRAGSCGSRGITTGCCIATGHEPAPRGCSRKHHSGIKLTSTECRTQLRYTWGSQVVERQVQLGQPRTRPQDLTECRSTSGVKSRRLHAERLQRCRGVEAPGKERRARRPQRTEAEIQRAQAAAGYTSQGCCHYRKQPASHLGSPGEIYDLDSARCTRGVRNMESRKRM